MKPSTCIAKPYGVLLIDPPWPQLKGGLRKVRPNQGRHLDYGTLSVTAIFDLLDKDVFSRAATPHSLFIWTVESFLSPCEQLVNERGYRRHCRLIWDKGNGMAPCHSIRFAHEYLIWYYKGGFIPVAPAVRGKFLSVFHEASREHSRKPEIAYQLIEQLYPDARRFDVFSRQSRQGWDQYGDQPGFFNL
ncbi:MT-A70 family methyltransferase [Mucilaginibacter rubeus]|uniref:MT-A70 family methyltransferase n=1 Tax=Mucilaginibacter rubeus TaxID=2027860 RepID=UPI001FB70947|nr:MT-A70 family methyltransferase [Mucilaginibacter rubeus]